MCVVEAPDFPRERNIQGRYGREFGHIMDWLAIQTYDAVDLLLWAANKSALDPDSMRGALHGLNSENSSIQGLADPIYFNPDGSLARGGSVAAYNGSRSEVRENKH